MKCEAWVQPTTYRDAGPCENLRNVQPSHGHHLCSPHRLVFARRRKLLVVPGPRLLKLN